MLVVGEREAKLAGSRKAHCNSCVIALGERITTVMRRASLPGTVWQDMSALHPGERYHPFAEYPQKWGSLSETIPSQQDLPQGLKPHSFELLDVGLKAGSSTVVFTV